MRVGERHMRSENRAVQRLAFTLNTRSAIVVVSTFQTKAT